MRRSVFAIAAGKSFSSAVQALLNMARNRKVEVRKRMGVVEKVNAIRVAGLTLEMQAC